MKGALEMNDKKTDGKKVSREEYLYHNTEMLLKNIVMSYGA